MKKEDKRLWCEVNKAEGRDLLKRAKRCESLNIESMDWDEKRDKMLFTLSGGTVCLQTQLVMKPGNMEKYERTSIKTLKEKLNKEARREFQLGRCKTCGDRILWITHPKTGRRHPVDFKSRTVFVKTEKDGGPVAKHVEEVYTSHNDHCKQTR